MLVCSSAPCKEYILKAPAAFTSTGDNIKHQPKPATNYILLAGLFSERRAVVFARLRDDCAIHTVLKRQIYDPLLP